MPLDEALHRASEEFRQANPLLMAARSGVVYAAGELRVPLLRRPLQVGHPAGDVYEADRRPVAPWLRLLVLHYLLTADGAPLADDWISFRQLPGGLVYQSAFATQSTQRLAAAFGNDLEGFRQAAQVLGGENLNRFGDGAFRFLVFPRLPMACLLWVADEELPPSADILFDPSAPHYLATEDLAVVGGYLSRTLIAAVRR